MTEEEAKNTRCCGPLGCGSAKQVSPRGFSSGWGTAAVDSAIKDQTLAIEAAANFLAGERFCIGSACMAWRWREQLSAGVVLPEGNVQWMSIGWKTMAAEPHRPAYVGEGWHWDTSRGVWIAGDQFEDRGFCGLAGKP